MLSDGAVVATSLCRLFLVDLAGADNFDLGAARAGRWVNRGVLAVGRVVLALANGNAHVPYRDYPLTSLFAAVLGSPQTAYSMMLTCVSPSEQSAIETRTMLEYAWKGSSLDIREREAYRQALEQGTAAVLLQSHASKARAAHSAKSTFKRLSPALQAREAAAAAVAAKAPPGGEPPPTGAAGGSGEGKHLPRTEGSGEGSGEGVTPVPWAMRMMHTISGNISAPGAGVPGGAAMLGDRIDAEEGFNRRTELIETRNGHVFARVCGDASMPVRASLARKPRAQASRASLARRQASVHVS